jgi:hypothetical protein
MGKVGKLNVTRLICGGNLFSGFAHSGDLIYMSSLLKSYFTDEKILETLSLCEESGINTAILRCDEQIVRVLNRFRKERGGKLQWIAQTYPTLQDRKKNIQLAIDNGAVGAFAQGAVAEGLVQKANLDVLAEVLAFIKQNKLEAGVGSHSIELPAAAEKARLNPDFYFKTINAVGYESQKPEEVAAFMKTVKKPWIGFKVLGAGRMKPKEGFDLAFRSGADFINVGMYEFQVADDVKLVRESVAAASARERAWSA